MSKLKVAVLMGGRSPEYKISIISGREVAKNLNPQKYDAMPVIISRDGRSFQLNNKRYSLSQLSTVNRQLFFIAMHGPNGEDGKMQGFLDLVGVPYTGSGVLASSLGMDKIYSRTLFSQAGLNVPRHVIVKKGKRCDKLPRTESPRYYFKSLHERAEYSQSSEVCIRSRIHPSSQTRRYSASEYKVWQRLEPPVFVKPRFQGSSVGTSKVNAKKDLKKACQEAHTYDDWAIVEEYLDGTEVTCAILGNENPKALPLVEIAPKKEYFDYEAKYDPNLTDEIVPARISPSLTQKAQKSALLAYKSLGCRGFGRVDMIIKNGDVYVLEVNTIPGLTPVSLFPKAAAAAGISYSELLDKIIGYSLEN